MLGWFVIVRRDAYEVQGETPDPHVLATWETSIGGLAWIEALERAGKAVCTARGGYPIQYTVRAADLLPILRGGQPPRHSGFEVIGDDYVTPAGWVGEMQTFPERMAKCDPEEQLQVLAWDQS